MGLWAGKTQLKWREPKSAGREVDGQEATAPPFWLRPFLVAVTAGGALLSWYLGDGDQKDPISFLVALFLGLAVGIFLIYVAPWIARFFPSTIKIRKDSISREMGHRPRVWQYKDIQSCRIARPSTGGANISVLIITNRDGSYSVIGIDPLVNLEELWRVLTENGVQVETN